MNEGQNQNMVLSAQEESLIHVVRALPPEQAGKVLNWARQLADLAGERTIGWSDSWTDEDLADATAAAVRRFEDLERDEVRKTRQLGAAIMAPASPARAGAARRGS